MFICVHSWLKKQTIRGIKFNSHSCMKINKSIAKKLLKEKNFQKLFIEELGWDITNVQPICISLNQNSNPNFKYKFTPIAHKRGFVVYFYNDKDKPFPDYQSRRKLERLIAKYKQEHFIIFIDEKTNTQIWQWVKLETGKPAICREHKLHNEHSGELLIQKLEKIAFDLDEEEKLTLIDIKCRLQSAVDVEKITKKFYERFKKEHDVFLNFISGIPDKENQKWYASIMLNRLMFTYFIQKKGFLDGDVNYLPNRLNIVKEKNGTDEFYNFYRSFLRRLFHEGLDKKEEARPDDLKKLIGKIPYLNGGIFQVHKLENQYQNIDIPDDAFEKLFDFFDQYDWHLDDRPLKKDNEINPDVLGYIFEKYINQKQMGAYYTKEDITEYISKNTIIPRLFDLAKEKCSIAFNENSPIWELLQENPDRYIYDAVKKGADLPLPEDIEIGIDTSKPNLLERRKNWNKPTPEKFALPTEIWRETIARRQRYFDTKQKLQNGEIKSIDDFITYNLNITQFAQDVISSCEGPELLRAFYFSIAGRIPEKSHEKFHSGMTVLDPTCGSGAFLFAALNILEPLYEACLDRMQSFVDELEGQTHSKEKYKDFKKILLEMDSHPTPKYFIYKSIILNNLFGVDIMDEAVEICKLRLFLKLAAQVEKVDQIEPLPDIDFNIRAGNTLVGFVNYEQVEKAVTAELDFDNSMENINEKAREADMAFKLFRQIQQNQNISSKKFSDAKVELRKRLAELENQLNIFLAKDYGITDPNSEKYQNWLKSYKPFHWYVDFYGIIHIDKGFDVIIGNPPYVEYSKVKKDYQIKGYETEKCGNLYAFCSERSYVIMNDEGKFGFIVPNSSISATKMSLLQNIITCKKKTWVSNYSWRPSKLFAGADMLLAIILSSNNKINNTTVFSSQYYKWYSEYREFLFVNISYNEVTNLIIEGSIPKIPSHIFKELFNKLSINNDYINKYLTKNNTKYVLYYFRAVQYWVKILKEPPVYFENEIEKITGEMKPFYFMDDKIRNIFIAILSSNVYFLYYIVWSSCQVINSRDFEFPISLINMSKEIKKHLSELAVILINDYQKNSKIKVRKYSKKGRTFEMKKQHFYIKKSKPIIDEIDKVLAEHYGFTEEELDFIINYDIKYRMGKELNAE